MTFDVWLLVDECGDYAVGCTEEEAKEAYENAIQPVGTNPYRMVKLAVRVPLPELMELAVEVPPPGAVSVA